MAASAPLIIVDNNLVDDRGHHLALARTLAEAALADGRAVHFYTHMAFRPSTLDERVVIHRVFATSIYEVFAMRRADIDLSPDFLAVFGQVADENETGTVLLHTADAHIYRALMAWFLPKDPKDRRGTGLRFHICTPYELRLLPGATAGTVPVGECIWRLANSPLCGVAYFFWSETDRLAEYYRRAFIMDNVALLLPAPQWVSATDQRELQDETLRLVFLGAARIEKGFMQLPALTRAIANHPRLAGRVKLRIQCSEPLAGYDPGVRKVIETLSTEDSVELVHGSFDVPTYAEEILRSDVVLMLYQRDNYVARGSGIAMEAFCCGKYLLSTSGTFVDSMDHHGLVLSGHGVADWVSHLSRLVAALPAHRKMAQAVGAIMRHNLTTRSYLKRLERRERFATHFTAIGACSLGHRQPMLVAPGRQIGL